MYLTSPTVPTLKSIRLSTLRDKYLCISDISKMQDYGNISLAKCLHLALEALSCCILLMKLSLPLSHHHCKHAQGHPENVSSTNAATFTPLSQILLYTNQIKYTGCMFNLRTSNFLWFQMKLDTFRNQ